MTMDPMRIEEGQIRGMFGTEDGDIRFFSRLVGDPNNDTGNSVGWTYDNVSSLLERQRPREHRLIFVLLTGRTVRQQRNSSPRPRRSNGGPISRH